MNEWNDAASAGASGRLCVNIFRLKMTPNKCCTSKTTMLIAGHKPFGLRGSLFI